MDKQHDPAVAVGLLRDGMTLGIGGWGSRRKPMALVRQIIRAGLRDLTVVSYGGPDVGMLCAAGCVRKLVFGFVTLDTVALEPYFRRARETGSVATTEVDEGMFQLGLRAAAMRVPFLPTRAGLGTALLEINPDMRTTTCPYSGEVLVAMPAIPLDAALVHVARADRLGNTRIDGPDPYFDELFVRAAEFSIVTAESVVGRLVDDDPLSLHCNYFERSFVRAVVEAPGGAHPTACAPAYGWDREEIDRYVASAREPGGWDAYRARLGADEAAYAAAVGGAERIRALPVQAL